MILRDLLQKPLSFILENHIDDNVIFSDASVSTLLDKMSSQLSNEKAFPDFLIVITDHDYIIKAVITNREVADLIQIVRPLTDYNVKVETLDLDKKFPPKYALNDTEKIEAVFNILRTNVTDMVIAKNAAGKYVGKIGRVFILKKMEALLS